LYLGCAWFTSHPGHAITLTQVFIFFSVTPDKFWDSLLNRPRPVHLITDYRQIIR
jgi:hypothetical protein